MKTFSFFSANKLASALSQDPTVFKNFARTSVLNTRNYCAEHDKWRVLIANAASGVGYATARLLLERCACGIFITDPNEKAAQMICQKLNKLYPYRVIFKKCDFTKKNQVEDLFETARKTFGLDVFINCLGPFNEGEFEKSMAVQAATIVHGTWAAMRHMGKHLCGNGGYIINMATLEAIVPDCKIPKISGANHFKLHFTRAMANQWYFNKTCVQMLALLCGPTEEALEDDCGEPKKSSKQKASSVARCVIEMLETGSNGQIYVANNDECCYKITMPDKKSYLKECK